MHNPNQAKDARPWTPLAAALIVAAFAPLLAGCSPEPAAEGSAGNDPSLIARENEHPQAVEAEQVIGATYIRAHETSRTFLISGTDAQRLYDAYLRGTVGNPVKTRATDYDDTVVFAMADGSEETVRFNARNVRDGDAYRSFDDEGGFWELLDDLALDGQEPAE